MENLPDECKGCLCKICQNADCKDCCSIPIGYGDHATVCPEFIPPKHMNPNEAYKGSEIDELYDFMVQYPDEDYSVDYEKVKEGIIFKSTNRFNCPVTLEECPDCDCFYGCMDHACEVYQEWWINHKETDKGE